MSASKCESQGCSKGPRSCKLSLRGRGPGRIEGILLLSVGIVVFSTYSGSARAVGESAETANVALIEREAQFQEEARNARGLRMAEAGQAAYSGESFRVGGRQVQLLRCLDKVAVRYPPSETFSLKNRLQSLTLPGREFLVKDEASERGIAVLQTSKFESLDELDESIRQLERTPGVVRAAPVYIHEESGLQLVPTDEFIVKLATDADLAVLQAINDALGAVMVRPLWGTTDQFILAIPDCTAEELLSTCEIYWHDPAVEWAHPNFLGEAVKWDVRPNDPLHNNQWHLPKIQAPKAWEATTGSSQVVIAVIDDGMDLTHEDLSANLWSNSLEIANNGVDDDNNGYIDDYNGWDFWAGDQDPGPAHYEDNHGTPVAGVAAAKGNNNLGVAGSAFDCTLMPLKVLTGAGLDALSYAGVAEALYYAAGRTKNGGRWRGADVISISLGFAENDSIRDALAFAATQGRAGKGCPIFCASGNDASGWQKFRVRFSGGYWSSVTITWRYEKDASGRDGDDTVWLDMITLPDGSRESFEEGLPTSRGWRTGTSASWRSVDEGIAGNHAVHGDGGSRALRAGATADNRSSWVQFATEFSVAPEGGELSFYAWPSSESEQRNPFTGEITKQGDGLRLTISVGGYSQYDFFLLSGSPSIHTAIGYPASHPDTVAVGASTDFDCHADYSQYGAGLDFLAPSSGGSAGIWTTDRTGDAGYAGGDYTSTFGGTSASTPLAAGVAALMLSKNPDLTAEQVRTIMQETCDKVGPGPYTTGKNQYYGFGRINAEKAVGEATGTGSLRVTISPQGAIDAGAQWRRVGTTTWRNSDAVEGNVPIGWHTVEFKAIAGWSKPSNQTVTVRENQTTLASATYNRENEPLITVISPNGGESWRLGTSHAITWTSSGDVGAAVEIQLFKGDLFVRPIAGPISTSDRSFTWAIPPDEIPGSDYQIRIISMSNSSCYDSSDNNFSIVGAPSAWVEDFESYGNGDNLHGQGGWKGWDNSPDAGAMVSNSYAFSGSTSVEIGGSADLVHEFERAGGQWVVSAMQYIPAGATGTSMFILLNTYSDGGSKDWSVQLQFDLGTGTITSKYDNRATGTILYDRWAELECVIDLDNNTVTEYYNGALFSTHPWDNDAHGTLGALDLYGNSASSVYYDDVTVAVFGN